ncbi:transporter [Arthrobacter sp. AZCC_0090]|uniref:SLAC1 family transporter n=1 Tax=Arthrobacter sp. AZCC_0090 TaxID=2735881 RepID=UPI0017F358D7|nr:transporter [Arthrobacter sp. AZCC_0090]MBB6403410.1 tellurite resistance protein [Arthrobacter sp. AZCC_0090]
MSAQVHAAHVAAPTPARMRVPLNTLAIPLGLAGLAQVWSVAVSALGAPFWLGQAFWLVAAIAWVWTLAVHVHRGTRTSQRLSHQLTNFAQGPLAALLPIAAMLIGASLHRTIPLAGTVVTLISMAAAAAFAAWILGFWMRGQLPLESVHGGYFLPISAAGLVGAFAAAEAGLDWLAVGSFAVGIFFWLVISVFFFLRLALRPTLPAALVPTLAIMIAPPAVASAAWLTISGGRPDHLFEGLTAMTVLMALIQVTLLRRYRALPFSLGFWSFTFPVASVAALAITWLRLLQPPAWQAVTLGVLAAVTLLVVSIAAKSILLLVATTRARRRQWSAAQKQAIG